MPVSLDNASPQMSGQLELPLGGKGEALMAGRSGEAASASDGTRHLGVCGLMERVVDAANLRAALKRVRRNKGSPGVDGMTVDGLVEHLKVAWPDLREQLLTGSYQPQPVKRQLIPKGGGGQRELGIPTVVDRFIQQAILQVLQPMFDPGFSEHSYGFRPGRSAHGAIQCARRLIGEGRTVVVDVDLSKFFDRVNHDVLMGRLAKRIGDRRLLKLIRRYLGAGVMVQGVVQQRYMGTPQGGPLSPLLANILLDEVDKELEHRGHAFVRYADDLNVYVRSKRAGDRVMGLLRRLFGMLHLVINEEKSAVASVFTRQFLGFAFWRNRDGVKLRIAPKALKTMKERIRTLTRRNRGRSLKQIADDLRTYLVGWKGYFRLADTPKVFRTLDEWLRHRLRAIQLKQWKRGRTIFRELCRRGLSVDSAARVAGNARSWWRNSRMLINVALPIRFFDELGVPRLATTST